MKTIGDLVSKHYVFSIDEYLYLPLKGTIYIRLDIDHNYLYTTDLSSYFNVPINSNFDWFEKTGLEAWLPNEMDLAARRNLDIPNMGIKIQKPCICDFHTQLLPYGCNCGGK